MILQCHGACLLVDMTCDVALSLMCACFFLPKYMYVYLGKYIAIFYLFTTKSC